MGGRLLEGPAMAERTLHWRDELGRWLKPFLARLGHKARRQMCPRVSWKSLPRFSSASATRFLISHASRWIVHSRIYVAIAYRFSDKRDCLAKGRSGVEIV